MAKKNPETSRLTRKAGAAPRVARKPRLAETAAAELAAAAPVVAAPEPAAPPPPIVEPVAPQPMASTRYTFRPVTPLSARAFLVAVLRRARRELETRTAPVRATLRSRFPWLPRFLVG
jgi:hypothetical protein